MAKLISNDIVERVADMPEAIEAIEDAFTLLGEGDATFQPRTDIWSPTSETGDYYCWGSLLGAIRDPPRLAFRFKSDILSWEGEDGNFTEEWYNMEPGKYMGFILLFDTSSGELIGLMNDGVIQHVRVGATAGVACDYLAREDARTVGILGSGGMARSYAEAFSTVRDITEIRVFSPTKSNREKYASEMSKRLGIDVIPVDTPSDAMQGVDIAATCTDAMQPVYDNDWFNEGQFLVNVHPSEIGGETFEDADKVITTNNQTAEEYLVGSEAEQKSALPVEGYHRGYQTTQYPTLDDLLTGRVPGRQDDSERIFYHNMSAGIQFAAVGNIIYEEAIDRGLGTEIPLEWFQQFIRN